VSERSNDSKPNTKMAVGLIVSIFLVWAIVVGLSGNGNNWFGMEWDFERTGQLGDSFGVIGALMASLAAYFTFQALTDEKAETAKLRDREFKRDRSERRNQAENTLFRMFDLRISILDDIRKRDVIENSYRRLTSGNLSGLFGPVDTTESILQALVPEIGHYLRFTYHIIKYICDNFEKNDRYQYVRLLRAQLSNSEQVIIAFNCAHGEGRGQFHAWVEEFSLLHNLDVSDKENFSLSSYFSENAFETSVIK
jgi:Putative phage abortive infection protein